MIILFLVLSIQQYDAQNQYIHPKDIEQTPFHKTYKDGGLVDVRHNLIRNVKSVVERFSDDVSLTSNVTEISNDDIVTINWSNADVKPTDMVAFYTPTTEPPLNYLDFRLVTEYSNYTSGHGTFSERLFNMRADYLVRYLKQTGDVLEVLAELKISVVDNEPLHGHIAITSQPGEMSVMWNSARKQGPLVKVSLYSDLQSCVTINAMSRTYTAEDLCGPRANVTSPLLFRDPGWMHHAVVKGLEPGVRYYYSYGTEELQSGIKSFIGPPYPGGKTKVASTTFIGYGDMGVHIRPFSNDAVGAGAVTKLLQQDVSGGDVEFILHFGDISYARGRAYMWDQFMTQLTNVSSHIPYMVSIGNHEYDHVSGGAKDPSGATGQGFHPGWGNYGEDGNGECGVPTMMRYIMPDNGNLVFWYSFDYGLVHVVQLSSEHDYTPGSRQFNWLAGDLGSVNRDNTPWVVVTSHRAIYTSQNQQDDHIVSRHMKMCLEQLFYQHKVNLHLSGHYHSYESTCSVVSGDCVAPGTGTVYIVVGTAGKHLDPQPYTHYDWSKSQQSDVYGYQRMVANHTHMTVQLVTVPDAAITDSLILPLWT